MDITNPTLEDFAKHARLFGDELVVETAESCLSPKDVARLRIDVDAARANVRGRYGTVIGTRRKRSKEETAKAAVMLSVEGLIPEAIAEKLGISDSYARRLVKA